jgi:hypothetical protein
MPSTSKKQHNFMAAIAHNPAFAKKVGVPQSVGKDFNEADKGRKFKQGGAMKSDAKEDMKMDKSQDKAMIKKAFKQHDSQEHKGGKGTSLTLKKGGGVKKMAKGGMTADPKAMMAAKMGRGSDRAGRAMASPTPDMMGRAMASKAAPPMMAKGGGVEVKGKTQGKLVSMKRGGRTC